MLPWLADGHISPYLDLAKALSRKNLSSQLVHPFVLPMPDEKEEESHINIIDWVNKKGQGSTIFMNEIALGLELSSLNFLWVPFGGIFAKWIS
ncbi:hypothetical protein M9H77_34470 [Catharanthus roseus]|uniref:Uncharacterized protein n=1 Tax=Catharanthus roseus TaxID=4058 RepID=A0ACB9ZM14_CATRO|nr:hypothetical protein M9H77_34470 [Catharanthus roseus]